MIYISPPAGPLYLAVGYLLWDKGCYFWSCICFFVFLIDTICWISEATP